MLVIHTREGHRPDLSDAPPAKVERGAPSMRIGDAGPMGRILIRGEPGHDIVAALAPLPGEPVIDKPGKGAFYQTDLDLMLRNRGIDTLLVCGVTTEVCVHTTIREANDRGYRCVALGDSCASYFPEFHEVGLRMITAQGGIFGWVSHSASSERLDRAESIEQPLTRKRVTCEHDDAKRPALWTPGDWNALFGFGTNILVNLLVLTGLLRFVLKMPDDLVFGRILPALGLMMFLSTGYYAWLAYRLAKRPAATMSAPCPRASACRICSSSPSSSCCRSGPHRRSGQGLGGRPRLGVLPELHPDDRRLRRALYPQDHAARGAARHAGRRLDRLHLDAPGAGDVPHAGHRPRLPRHHPGELVRRRALSARHPGGPRRHRGGHGHRLGLGAARAGRGRHEPRPSSPTAFANFGFSLPIPAFDHVFSGFEFLGVILVTAIPFGIYDLVEAMDNVESAEAAGDHYPTTRVLTADGVVSLIGCLMGNPFINAVYIGHPGWKAMGGRIGYSAATGLMVIVLAWFGIIAVLLALVPVVAISPILLYIGMLIGAQAFQTTPTKHAPAIVLALTPHLAAWAKTLIDGALGAAGTNAATVGLDKLGNAGVLYHGLELMGGGAILTGLVLGAIGVFIIEKDFTSAAGFAFAGAVLTFFGFMHGEAIGIGSGLGVTPSITLGYLMVGGVLLACGHLVREAEGMSTAPEPGAQVAAAE